jgi:beta-fructofuranosidase
VEFSRCPRELSLPDDGVLRIKPLRELETLRHDEKREADLVVKSDARITMKGVEGDAIELKVSIDPGDAREFGVEVYGDKEGKAGFAMSIEPVSRVLRLGDVSVPFELRRGERLDLRIFLDKNMIEVFANDRQAAVASHKYEPENLGISFFSKGGRCRRERSQNLEDEINMVRASRRRIPIWNSVGQLLGKAARLKNEDVAPQSRSELFP